MNYLPRIAKWSVVGIGVFLLLSLLTNIRMFLVLFDLFVAVGVLTLAALIVIDLISYYKKNKTNK